MAKRNMRGDTIIEVLLAMAVIGVVLGSAYATTRRNLMVGRFAQERTEALKVAESQLERIKALAATEDRGNVFDLPGTAFCVDDTNDKAYLTDVGQPCSTIDDSLYDASATFDNAVDTFTVVVTWDPPTGNYLDRANVTMRYKVHP